MNFVAAHWSSVGVCKEVNQDSLCIKGARYRMGNIILAAVCDGMGGTDEGEVASKLVIDGFSEWFEKRLPGLLKETSFARISERCIGDWKRLIINANRLLCEYGRKKGIRLGTTLSAILIFPTGRYVIGHVGDSRIYEIREGVRMLTEDQSLVADEARKGMISWNEAYKDPRRNVLLECIGINDSVSPIFLEGNVSRKGARILVCSDGFYHELSDREIREKLKRKLSQKEEIRSVLRDMIWLCERKGEKDNISAILINVQGR